MARAVKEKKNDVPLPVELWLFKDPPRIGVRITAQRKALDAEGRPAKYIAARGATVDAALTNLVTKIAADADIAAVPQADDLEIPPAARPDVTGA